MIMDAKDLQSDLHALTTLYGLLRKDGGEAPNTGSDSLDAHARALLKNLLDTATIRVLSALNSEVIAGQTKASGVLFPTRLQQSDETLRPTAVEGDQSREKELDSDSRLTPDYWSQAGSVPAIGLKRCRLCRRDTVKQLAPTGETRFYDVAENSNIFAQNNVSSDHHHHLRNHVKEIGWLSGNVSNNFVYPMYQPLPPSVKKEERNQPYLSLCKSYMVQPTKVIDSEEEFYSPSSGEGGHEVTSGSSKGYVSYEQPISSYARPKHVLKQSASNKSRPSRIENAYNMNHNKEYGILKRMKKIPEVHHHHHVRGHQESDSTTCDSCSNSSSQQTSDRQYSRYRSNNEGEFYSSSRGEGARSVTASSSSESEGYSSYGRSIGSYARPKHLLKRSTSRKSGPSRIEKPYGISHTKHSGILKRMKDKLEVIFHHHHHHHHHNRGDDSNDEESMSHNSSLDKRKGKAIDSKRKDDTYGAKAVAKIRKSHIREKRQNNNFLGLVGGVLRHIRHSKQSKPGKGAADRFAGEYFRKRRTLKKSRQWKLLQHHGRSKLPNKSHSMKFGLGKKKKPVLKSSLKDIE